MINGWMLWVWGAALLAGLAGYVISTRSRRARRGPSGLAVANTALLTRLPRYGRLMRQHRRVVVLLGAAALLLLASAVGMSVRPASTSRADTDNRNRDIEFCLDVSGSMEESNARITESLVALGGQLTGQRVGLTIFAANAMVKFPLTDDARYVAAQLEIAHQKLAASPPDATYVAGAFADMTAEAGTLVGDGLMTCVRQFDQLSENRARSIVLTTDNDTDTAETYTVPQAAAVAARDGIRVYAFMPMDGVQDADLTQMRSATASTGGSVYPTDASSSVTAAARQILAEEATRLKAPPVLTRVDRPLVPFAVGLVAVAVLLIAAWRVER